MRNHACRILLLTLIAVACIAGRALSADGCCAHCGCTQGAHKVCRLVCEEKKVDVICWGHKCEDFCVPGPSKPDCTHCETICASCPDTCDVKAPHGAPKRFVWTDWIPGCATTYTKSKLMQKVVTKKVPSYKWVVEDLCPDCQAKFRASETKANERLPPDAMAKPE